MPTHVTKIDFQSQSYTETESNLLLRACNLRGIPRYESVVLHLVQAISDRNGKHGIFLYENNLEVREQV